MKTHALKTDPLVFDDVAKGLKTFEIRKDDRGYQVGDRLFLERTRYTGAEMQAGFPLEYTGEKLTAIVTHILKGPMYGLAESWVILSIKPWLESEQITPHHLPLDIALTRWSVVHRVWHEMANDCPNLGAFLAGWFCRCTGVAKPIKEGACRDSFRAGWKEASEQIGIDLQKQKD